MRNIKHNYGMYKLKKLKQKLIFNIKHNVG